MASRRLINVQAEIKVILGLLDGTVKMRSRILLRAPDPSYFGYGPTREIYERIRTLHQRNKRIPSSDIMATDSVLSEDAIDLLQNPGVKKPRLKNLRTLIDNLNDYRILREVADTTSSISRLYNQDNQREEGELKDVMIRKMEQCVLKAHTRDATQLPFGVGQGATFKSKKLRRLLSKKNEDAIIPTGMADFDSKVRGIRRSQVTIFAANTGGLKTTLSLFVAINAYLRYNRSVAFVTFEMSEEEVIEDTSSNITGIPAEKISNKELTPSEQEAIVQAWKEFHDHGKQNHCRFKIFALSDYMTPTDVESLLAQGGYDVWVVDYVQLLKHGKISKSGQEGELWQKLGEIVRDFKLISKRNKVATILLAQADEGKKIRYARMISENADNILYWMYNEEHKGIGPNGTGVIKIDTMKGRRFGTFSFYLEADPAHKTFRTWKGPVPEIYQSKKKRKGARDEGEESMSGV